MLADVNKFIVNRELTFANVMQVWNDSLLFLQQQTELHVDFSKVQHADSAGLALILEWLGYARDNQKKIVFHAVPNSLRAIAAAAGVSQLF